MDTAVNAGVTLDELRATAPRGFDKTLIDLLAKVQEGQRPIIVPASEPAVRTVVERETLPSEVADLITEMASQLARINLELIETQRRLSAIESIEIDKRLLRGAA